MPKTLIGIIIQIHSKPQTTVTKNRNRIVSFLPSPIYL